VAEPGSGNGVRDASIGELLKRLSEDVRLLVRQEIELARAEIARKAATAGIGLALLGVAAALGLGLLGALVAALILGLAATALPAWAAALVAAGVLVVLAGLAALAGVGALRRARPADAVREVKEDLEWIADPKSSARR
jgi:uncharacterized membrane protein YqjE